MQNPSQIILAMFKRFYPLAILIFIAVASSCTLNDQSSQQDYKFEPEKSIIKGTLTTEQIENEKPFIFILESAINVVSSTEVHEEGDQNYTRNNITKVQLTSTHGIVFDQFKGKKLKLTGTFFGAATAHHHTEVLMDVESVEELK
jgi:hypothetical protein